MDLRLDTLWDGAPPFGQVGGSARITASGILAFTWDVLLPAPPRAPDAAPGFHDGLWEHDVVELFLTRAAPGDPAPRYLELEVGPRGHWLALGFEGVRCRVAEMTALAPVVATRLRGLRGLRWQGSLRAPLEAARAFAGDPPWRGLACLVTTSPATGQRVHLTSSRLPGTHPDFHQPSAWPQLGVRSSRGAVHARSRRGSSRPR